MEIISLGDSALILRLRDHLKRPDETLAQVLQTVERLQASAIPGVLEITPAFTSVGIYFDPAKVAAASEAELPNEWLIARIQAALKSRRIPALKKKLRPPIEIPVCYALVFAPDLPVVAERSKLSEAEVIRRHVRGKYRVQCVGFIRFPYLSGLANELATPRRDTPRKTIPPGSVAIGGALTGIYLQTSPGGWNIIGRTPLRLFDVARDPATLLQIGDRVRFRAITLKEFNELSTR